MHLKETIMSQDDFNWHLKMKLVCVMDPFLSVVASAFPGQEKKGRL